MATLLKEVYSPDFIRSLAERISSVYPNFATQNFQNAIFNKEWSDKALKARMNCIAENLYIYLPENFQQSIEILKQVARYFSGYEAMFFPTFVEFYGLKHYQISIDALAFFTQYSSSEFAVRAFILAYPNKMMAQMLAWTASDNFHIRRLASEGCRPRLPWAQSLPLFKKDPSPILQILEQLKDDPCDYVYRSVANNLNDIGKDNPATVTEIATRWLAESLHKNRVWIVKHACRSLLKKADPKILKLFAFNSPEHIQIKHLELDKVVQMGEILHFSCELKSALPLGKLRIEFAIHFMKKNGKQAPKIFKISESTLLECNKKISKSFSFKKISTRRYYLGEHQLTIIVNGDSMAKRSFLLQDKSN